MLKRVILSEAKDLLPSGSPLTFIRENAPHWIFRSLRSFEMTRLLKQVHARRTAKGLLFLFLGFLLVGLTWSDRSWAGEKVTPTRPFTDRLGRTVAIPIEPQRIACMHGPSYEKLFALGGGDRVALASIDRWPWAHQVNPSLKKLPVLPNLPEVDVEQMLRFNLDLVLYQPYPAKIEKMSRLGLPVIVCFAPNAYSTTLNGFLKEWHDQIRFYGDILGSKAREVAEQYWAYAHERLNKVVSITSRIPPEKRPKVFYITGGSMLGTEGRFTTPYWLVEAAGGTMLTDRDYTHVMEVTMEQVIAWNPDIIIVGTHPSADPIKNDPRWQRVKAVREKKVFVSPEGIFYWSHFSTESFLAIMFMARIFHPDGFADINLKKELVDYYARFYRYNLTDDEADRILNHLPPKGYKAYSGPFYLRKDR